MSALSALYLRFHNLWATSSQSPPTTQPPRSPTEMTMTVLSAICTKYFEIGGSPIPEGLSKHSGTILVRAPAPPNLPVAVRRHRLMVLSVNSSRVAAERSLMRGAAALCKQSGALITKSSRVAAKRSLMRAAAALCKQNDLFAQCGERSPRRVCKQTNRACVRVVFSEAHEIKAMKRTAATT